MKCEVHKCNKKATQADLYINSWLCDDHYSYIGLLTQDYQAKTIDWFAIDQMVYGI